MEFIKRVQYEVEDKEEADKIIAILEAIGFKWGKKNTDLTGSNLYLRTFWDQAKDEFGINNNESGGIAPSIKVETFNQWYKEATGRELYEDEGKTVIKDTQYPFKSIGWWYSRIKEDKVREGAFYNNKIQKREGELSSGAGSIQNAICGGFTWKSTQEGDEFWHKIYTGKTEIILLPEPKTSNNSIINNSKTNKNEYKSNTSERKPILSQSSISISRGERYTGTERHCRTKKSGITSGSLSFREVTSH